MATPEQESSPLDTAEAPERQEGESLAEFYQRLNDEWSAQGHSPEAIGDRIRQLLAEAPEEEEPDEPITPDPAEPEDETGAGGVASMPLCPVCKGLGHVPEQLQAAKDYDRCPDCGGLGTVMTGSLKEDHALLQCTRCTGNGYVNVPVATEPPSVPQRNW